MKENHFQTPNTAKFNNFQKLLNLVYPFNILFIEIDFTQFQVKSFYKIYKVSIL